MQVSLVLLSALVALIASTNALLVQQPCCSAYAHAGASFGPRLPWVSPGVAAKLSRAQDKDCTGAVEGELVMIDRGLEPFVDAVRACQQKGARAVIVRNVPSSAEGENDVIVMGALKGQAEDIRIPSVFISKRAGNELDVLLTMNENVFVELFAADDVNSIMAYIAYLMMSLETLLFGLVFLSVFVCLCSRRMARRGLVRSRGNCCRSPRSSAVAMLVNDRALLEPLNGGNSMMTSDRTSSATGVNASIAATDIESKPASMTRVLPVVFADTANQRATAMQTQQQMQQQQQQQQQQQHVSLQVNPDSDEPVFDQQEQ